jgi:hypothetical protein
MIWYAVEMWRAGILVYAYDTRTRKMIGTPPRWV